MQRNKTLQKIETEGEFGRLLSRTEMHHNVRGQIFKSEQSLVEPKTGKVKRKLESQTWFDTGGRAVKQKHSGRRGTNVTEYTPNSQVKRSSQLSESGEILVESKSLYDRCGRAVGGVQKNRKPQNARKTRRDMPSDFGPAQEAASRFTKQWFDPFGRVIANADYGYVEADAEPVQDYIPKSSGTVRVYRTIYDPLTGRILTSIDIEGRETRSFADAAGRTVKTIANYTGDGVFDPAKPTENITTEMRYDIAGNLVWQRDPAGNVTENVYDKLGRLMVTIAPNRGKTFYEYNLGGEVISVTDPMGRVTRFEYDSLGRRVKTILPKPNENSESPVQTTVYNELGQVDAQIDPLGNISRFEYDEQGRKVKQTDANGGVTWFSYNDEGQLLSLTDPVGNTTRYEYDELGRVVKETNELGKSRFFEYLPSGLLAEKTDRNSRTTLFKYDRFGQMVEEHWLDGKRTLNRICSEYDKTGRLIKVGDTKSTFEYGYDSLGRQNIETVTFAGLNEKVTLRNSFDVLGRRISQTAFVGQREDYTNHWTYNNIGQVDEIVQDNKRVKYSYNLAGQRASVEADGVYYSALSYDGMGRLMGIDYKNPIGETLAKYGLTWDTASRIVAMNLNGEPAEYSYDVTNQLVSASYEKLPQESYQYDANGNRKNFVTGKNNQLTNDGVFKYTYDNEGNRTAKVSKNSRTEYFWDHRNRLVKAVADDKIVEYVYDHRNRLLRRNDEFFVHDGWQIVLILDSKANVKERYLWGTRQDELIAENNNWVLCDHLGTVRDVVDSTGKIVSHLEYNAFGELLSITGDKPLLRYTGKLFDDVTQLQWNINRWYDAKVGRWISEDPIGFEGKDGNLERYVYNQTIYNIDYYGKYTYAVNGTSSAQGGQTNVEQFSTRSLDGSTKWDGPNALLPPMAGIDSRNIMYDVIDQICQNNAPSLLAKKKLSQTLDLVGYSRGATVVFRVAKWLNQKGCAFCRINAATWQHIYAADDNNQNQCQCLVRFTNLPVRFVGLFDAVNQTQWVDWGWDLAVPANVQALVHAIHTDANQNVIFPTLGIMPQISFNWIDNNGVIIPTTHSDLGNNPAILDWMINEAKKVGVPML